MSQPVVPESTPAATVPTASKVSVAYHEGGQGHFDGCQRNAPNGELGIMDEQVTYNHTGAFTALSVRRLMI